MKPISLLAETVGSNTILNDGTINNIAIRITNYGKEIVFSTADPKATRIELILYAPAPGETGELSLARLEDLKAIRLEGVDTARWTITPGPNSPTCVTWTITNKNQYSLKNGQFLELKLEEVKTKLVEGATKIHINYYNIPDYEDGTLYVDIVKSPLVYRGDRVGIGTNHPNHTFHVKTGDAVGLFESIGTTAYLRLQTSEGGDKRVEFANRAGGRAAIYVAGEGQDALNVLRNGNVGIGTENPHHDAKLQVMGQIWDDRGPVMPKGAIILWHGSTGNIPAGWTLCDGQNGTPDLQDKFIVGAGKKYKPGNEGGKDKVTLTEAEMPAHQHFGFGESTGNWWPFGEIGENEPGSKGGIDRDNFYYGTTYAGGEGGKQIQKGSSATSTPGVTQGHENLPPYHALCYIMKL